MFSTEEETRNWERSANDPDPNNVWENSTCSLCGSDVFWITTRDDYELEKIGTCSNDGCGSTYEATFNLDLKTLRRTS